MFFPTITSDNVVVTNGRAILPPQCDFAGGCSYNAPATRPRRPQYTMTASANPTAPRDAAVPAQSQSYAVLGFGAPAQLAFTTQPTGVARASPSAVFTGLRVVAVEDAFANVVTTAAVTV